MADDYKVYRNDAEKATVYGHRLGVADTAFEKWEPKARDWYSRYENMPKPNQFSPKGHRVNVTTGVATIDALYSAMTAVEVGTLVRNLGQGSPAQAELATTVLAKEWELLDVTGETADTIKDALVVGLGWVKVGYEYVVEVQRVPRPVDEVRGEVRQLITEAIEAGREAPTADQIGQFVDLEEDREFVLRDRMVVDYVAWDDIRFDPTAKRPRDIRWVAQYTKMPVSEVKENPIWRAYAKRSKGGLKRLDELKGDASIEKELLPLGKAEDDDLRVTVVEFFDLDTGTVCTFVKGAKWLLNEGVNPFALNLDRLRRSPFVPLVLRATTSRVRGVSDMELITPTLDELNVYRSKLANYVERFVPKVVLPEGALTPEGKEALGSPEFGAAVEVSTGTDPASIKPLEPPIMPSEVFEIPARLVNDIYEATGANELMRGLFPDRKRTATETAEVVNASQARQAEKRNTLSAFYREVARRMIQLMQQFYGKDRMVRYVDTRFGEVEWNFTADDIIFEYDLDVQLTPMEARTRQSLRDDAIAELNMLGPFAQPGPDGSSVVELAALIERFCKQWGMTRGEILDLLNLPEEQQAQKMERLQDISAQGQAQAGFPDPAQVAGPLGPEELAAFTNQGAVPDNVTAAAVGGIGPLVPEAVEAVSESAGVRQG